MEFLTGEPKGSHDPSCIVFTVKGHHPSPVSVVRMLREHADQTT